VATQRAPEPDMQETKDALPPQPQTRSASIVTPSAIGGAIVGGLVGSVLDPAGTVVGFVGGGLLGESLDRRQEAKTRRHS